jgi:hypothetical protein
MTSVNSASGDEPAAVSAAVHHSPAGLPSARRPRRHRPHDLSHSDALLRPRQGQSPSIAAISGPKKAALWNRNYFLRSGSGSDL